MSNWSDLEDEMSDACDDQYAESFELHPMRTVPNVRPTPDNTRATITIDAILSAPSKLAPAMPGGTRNASWLSLSTDAPRLRVDLRRFPSGWELRHLDQVVRVRNGARYEIVDIEPDGQGRIACPMKHLRGPT